MYTLKIQNASGELFDLTHDRSAYSLIKVTGLTPPKAQINTTTAGVLDGTFFNSARVDERNIVLTVVIEGDIETNRQQLYRIFPSKSKCRVYFKNTNMDVQIDGYVEVVDGDLFVKREQMQISIICPRPFWQALSEVAYELSTTLRRFEFPFSIEESPGVPISEYSPNPQIFLYNDGSVPCGFTASIEISGSCTGLTLYNLTTQTKIGLLPSIALQAGDVVEISTIPGSLSIKLRRESDEINLINWLSTGSTFFTLATGENILYYDMTGSSSDVHCDIFPVFLYGGV